MLSLRTTISCRFFAPLVALALLLPAPLGARQQERQGGASKGPALSPSKGPLQLVPDAVRWFVALSAPATLNPTITERYVFTVLASGIVAAYRTDTGAEAWRVELTAEHPVVAFEDRVFVAAGEAIHALRAADGGVVWRQPAGTLTAPLLVHAGWVISATEKEMTARRAADGTQVWTLAIPGIRKKPTIDGDVLYLAAEHRVIALNLSAGRLKWEKKLRAPSEIAAFGRRVYVGSDDKFFYCLDADDGTIEWPLRAGAGTVGRPALDADRVYFTTMDNYVRALDLESGAIRWQFGLPFRPSAGPQVVGSLVVVPGPAQELTAIDAATGKAVKNIPFDGPLAGSPAFQETRGIPLVAAVTGGIEAEWKLSLLEPTTTIPTAPLIVLPGQLVPLGSAPAAVVVPVK